MSIYREITLKRIEDGKVPKLSNTFSWTRIDDTRYLMFVTPCGHYHRIPVSVTGIYPGHWLWNGDLELPTLTQSIRCLGTDGKNTDCWHGFLRNGVLVKA